MTWCVYFVIVLLVATKFCDVLSTAQKISNPHGETNPIARLFMVRVGTTKAIWGVCIFAMIIIGIAGMAAIMGSTIVKALFVIVGVMISIVQGAVAHCNWTGVENMITRHVRALHSGILNIVRK